MSDKDRVLPFGFRSETVPVPPDDAKTRYFEAGPLTVGVEYRVLNEEILNAHLAGDAKAKAVHSAVMGELGITIGDLNDQGVSVHVLERGTKREYLRFDTFDDDPHYHYITPGDHHVCVYYDNVANADYLGWIFARLRSDLPTMLRHAGADDLATRVEADPHAILTALPAVEQAAHEIASTHTNA